jgi:hypothetical protein
MIGVRPIFSYPFSLRIRFRTYHAVDPHTLPQSDMRRRMQRYPTGTNMHKRLSALENPNRLRGRVVGLLRARLQYPTPAIAWASGLSPTAIALRLPLPGLSFRVAIATLRIGVGRLDFVDRGGLRHVPCRRGRNRTPTTRPRKYRNGLKQPLNFSGCTYDTY